MCLIGYYSPKPTIVPDPHTQQGHDNHCPKAEWRLQEAPARRGIGAQAPLSACSSQEPMCCAGWKQQGDECGIGEWDILGTWAVGLGAGRRAAQVPSCPQRCAKATPRVRRTRCACGLASAAAAMATSVPTATPVSAGQWGWILERWAWPVRGAGSDPGTRSSVRAHSPKPGWGVGGDSGRFRVGPRLPPECPGLATLSAHPCRVPAPVLGTRLQGAVHLPPARAVRGCDRPVYVSRAALGSTLRARVPVPARRVPPAERRVPLRAGLVGRAVLQRVLLQCHVALRPTDGRVPVPRRLVGPQLQQSVRLQHVTLRATERPLPVPGANVRRALRALLSVLPRPLPPGGRHVRLRAGLPRQVLPGDVPRRLLRPGLSPQVGAGPGREGGGGPGGRRAGRQRRRGLGGSGPRLASRPFLP